MDRQRDRRLFLKSGASAMAVAAAGTLSDRQAAAAESSTNESANEKIVVGIMGVNGRGKALAKGFMSTTNAEVGAVCDVDSRAAESAAAMLVDGQRKPKVYGDVRKMLEDRDLDALVIAAPNHWHAPATILGCQAGLHVYVEKPCSHTPQEGEWAVEAARKHDRVVQMGSQRRTWPGIVEAIGKLHAGEIGRVLYARTWYNNRRPSVGPGKPASVPGWLDWDLWQGPAPRHEYQDNIVHYNWHWHWHWGNGELGNNGIHALDVARWGAEVTYPERVTAGGGKHRHEDSQETPDTMMVTFDFPEKKTITWEGLSWSPLGPHGSRFGISFHGTEGSMVIRDPGYTIYDLMDKEISSGTGAAGDEDHLVDFLDAIRTGRRPNADIEEAHRSTLLCHLGNIAYRTDSTLTTDPSNGHIKDNAEAEQLWSREYAKEWQPEV